MKPHMTNDHKPKQYLFMLSVCVLVVLGFAGCGAADTGPSAQAPAPEAPAAQPSGETDNAALSDEYKEVLHLNFTDNQVVFTGYPYQVRGYAPKLFTIVYIGMVSGEEATSEFIAEDAASGGGSYMLAGDRPTIFIPIGLAASGLPIWQTMSIVDTSAVASLMAGCSPAPYELNDLKATRYVCEKTEATKQFAGGAACFLDVDGESGILYVQYSDDESVTGDMCDVLTKNGMTAVEFKPYE